MEAQLIANIKNGIDVDNNLLQLHQQYANITALLGRKRKVLKEDAEAIALATIWSCAIKYDATKGSAFATYFWTALDNELLKDFQKRIKHNAISHSTDDLNAKQIVASLAIDDPKIIVEKQKEKKELLDAIQNSNLMTSREKQVFTLLRDNDRKTVAAAMGITRQRVEQILKSIRTKINGKYRIDD